MADAVWTVAQAKARLSEMLDQALSHGPQIITRSGKTTAVLVSAEEWERKSRRTGNLAEFFAASPLRGSDLELDRRQENLRDAPREIDL